MTYGEASRHVRTLAQDPSTMVCAAVNGWDSPRTREWFLLADLYDLTHRANAAKPQQVKPYPRPYPEAGTVRRGRTDRSRAEVLAILAAHGHDFGGD